MINDDNYYEYFWLGWIGNLYLDELIQFDKDSTLNGSKFDTNQIENLKTSHGINRIFVYYNDYCFL